MKGLPHSVDIWEQQQILNRSLRRARMNLRFLYVVTPAIIVASVASYWFVWLSPLAAMAAFLSTIFVLSKLVLDRRKHDRDTGEWQDRQEARREEREWVRETGYPGCLMHCGLKAQVQGCYGDCLNHAFLCSLHWATLGSYIQSSNQAITWSYLT